MDGPGELIYDWNRAGAGAAPRRRVTLNDETLRDGLQMAAACDPTIGEKVELLHFMEGLGIEMANLGYPAAGKRPFEDALRLAREIDRERFRLRPICAARTLSRDIDPVRELSERAGVPVAIALFVAASRIRLEVEGWRPDGLLRAVEESVGRAVRAGLEVAFITEDTTRAHPEILSRLYGVAIANGARRVVACDTVGHATPAAAAAVVSHVRELVQESGAEVGIDWHGHNDRGLALANSLAVIEAGADRLHGCALGIGERCGNASIDQLIVNLSLLGLLEGERDLTLLPRYVRRVSEVTGIPVPPNYPVTGRTAFETAAGVHASAVHKSLLRTDDPSLADLVYSGVPATRFGLSQRIRIGPHSGRANVLHWLGEHGFEPRSDVVARILEAAKAARHVLTDEELRELAGP